MMGTRIFINFVMNALLSLILTTFCYKNVTTRLKVKGEGQKVNSELKRILYHSKELKKDTLLGVPSSSPFAFSPLPSSNIKTINKMFKNALSSNNLLVRLT